MNKLLEKLKNKLLVWTSTNIQVNKLLEKLKNKLLVWIGKDNPNLDSEEDFEDDREMRWNIYEPNQRVGKHLKHFHIVHYIFKYRFWVPLMKIAGKIVGSIPDKIDERWYNKNLKIFDEAVEKSSLDWEHLYIYSSRGPKSKKKTRIHTQMSNYYHQKGPVVIRIMKKLMILMCLYDTAYREWFNIFVHNFTHLMQKEYEGEDIEVTDKEDNTVRHLIYHKGDTYDTKYYIWGRNLMNGEVKLDEIESYDEDFSKDKLLLDTGGTYRTMVSKKQLRLALKEFCDKETQKKIKEVLDIE